jgi:dolichyl-phosphate-mannose-protein mannosyltransferase
MLEIAAQPPAPTAASPCSWLREHALLTLILAGIVGRLVLALAPGHDDVRIFTIWADELAARGPLHFYDTFRDYLPGYLYFLWITGELRSWLGISDGVYHYILKMPALVADIASALLLYHLLHGQTERTRLFAVALYLALPPVLFVGVLWGQVDSILAFLLLLTIYYFDRRRPVAAGVALTLAFVFKPQAVAALPAFAVWAFRQYDRKTILRVCGAGALVGLVIILPFFPQPLNFLLQVGRMTNRYQFNALHTLNFWSMWGWNLGDDHLLIGTDWRTWGLLLTIVAYIPIIMAMRRANDTWSLALGVAICILVFYTFQTRMHERYNFPVLLPFLAACALSGRRSLWLGFIGLSVLELVAFAWAYGDQFVPVRLVRMVDTNPWHIAASPAVYVLSIAATALTIWLLVVMINLLPKKSDRATDPAG